MWEWKDISVDASAWSDFPRGQNSREQHESEELVRKRPCREVWPWTLLRKRPSKSPIWVSALVVGKFSVWMPTSSVVLWSQVTWLVLKSPNTNIFANERKIERDRERGGAIYQYYSIQQARYERKGNNKKEVITNWIYYGKSEVRIRTFGRIKRLLYRQWKMIASLVTKVMHIDRRGLSKEC